MQLSQEQIEKIFAEITPSIAEQLKKDILQTVDWKTREAVGSMVHKEVVAWAEANIVPALREKLEASKGAIVSAAIPAAEGIATLVAESLLKQLKENLSSYKRDGIFKALFG